MTAVVEDALVQVETPRFGTIEVDPRTIVHFPLGLLGLERFSRYVILDSDATAPMRWLQCIDAPEYAMLVVEPDLFFADYAPHLNAEDRDFLQLGAGETPGVACIVVVPDNPAQMTINLLGPLVFNVEKRVGKQLVLADSQFSARQRLLPDPSPADAPVAVG